MAHAAFVAVIFCALGYVALKKRPFDALTVAILSQFIYFLPLILGSLPKSLSSSASSLAAATIRQPIAAGTYWLAAILVAATGLGAVLVDAWGAPPRSPAAVRRVSAAPVSLEACLLLIAAAGLAVQWLHIGGAALFSADKLAKLTRLGQGFVVFETAAALACVVAFNARNWLFFCCALALLGLDLLIGFRYMAALTALAIALLYFSRRPASVLFVASWRLWLPAILLFLFLLNWPFLHQMMSVGNLAAISVDRLLLSTEIAVRTFEPFVTQSVLDRVVTSGFACAPHHFLGLLTLFVPFGNLLGLKVDLIGTEIQHHLFPEAHYGVGSNILAEMFCSLGTVGVIVFSVAFAGTLALLSHGLRKTRGAWQAVLAVEAVLFAFYIYRNDLYYLLLLVRRVALVALLGAAVQWAACEAARRLPAFQKPRPAR